MKYFKIFINIYFNGSTTHFQALFLTLNSTTMFAHEYLQEKPDFFFSIKKYIRICNLGQIFLKMCTNGQIKM